MKDWFKARNIWGAAIQTLTDAEAGRLMKALWEYTMTGHQAELQGAEKGIFALILMTLGQDMERESEISEKRAISGSIGGKKRAERAEKSTSIGGESGSERERLVANDSRIGPAGTGQSGPSGRCAGFPRPHQPIRASDRENDGGGPAGPSGQSVANQANATNKNKNQNKSKSKNTEKDTKEKERAFGRFWEAYPKHMGRQVAETAFEKIDLDEELLERMITAIGQWQKTEQWNREGGRFIPLPATWLNQRRWEDELPKEGRKTTVIAQEYEQRDYSGVEEELRAQQDREMEEWMTKEDLHDVSEQ